MESKERRATVSGAILATLSDDDYSNEDDMGPTNALDEEKEQKNELKAFERQHSNTTATVEQTRRREEIGNIFLPLFLKSDW